MNTLDKFYALTVLCTASLAAIAGTAYLFCDHHGLFGVTNILLCAMAFPYVKGKFQKLISE